MRHSRRTRAARRAAACAAGLALGLAGACATNPVTGQSQFTLMSEDREIQLGRQLDEAVRREMGVYDDPDLQRYVTRVGQRLAAVSHRPGLPWHFAVVDETAVNAFALPGGYVYLTRGILPFLDDEAELAGVLGHEIGHVTARHAVEQYTKTTSAGVGLAVLGIFVPSARPVEGLAQTALGVLFLKYGREDELQADRLGAEYAARAGWDPHGVPGMLTTLSRLDEASSSSGGVPGWLSTHPDPADRVAAVQPAVRQAVTDHPGELVTNQAGFLPHLEGLVFGDDPEEGVIRGRRYLHAGLRFRLAFPQGWEVTNGKTQVTARRSDGDALLVLRPAEAASGSIETAARAGMQDAGFTFLEGGLTNLNGLRAFVGTYRGQSADGTALVARAAHIEHGGRLYLLAGVAREPAYQAAEPAFAATIRSFQGMTAAEAEALRPNRIALSVVRAGDTWTSIAGRAGEGLVRASTLAIMNHSPVDRPPRPGERIKVVVAR